MKKLIYVGALSMFPTLVLAAETFSQTRDFIFSAKNLLDLLTGVAAALALLVFFWGLVKYIAKAEDSGEKESGRTLMVNGAIALFVLFAIFGILRWISAELLLPDSGPLAPPTVTTPEN